MIGTMDLRCRPHVILLTLVAICVMLMGVAGLLVNVVPTRTLHEITSFRMVGVCDRIDLYVRQNARLPSSLEGLEQSAPGSIQTTDAWKRTLVYRIDAHDRFVVMSLGEDGKPGGTGQDEDITLTGEMSDGHVKVLESPLDRRPSPDPR